MKLPPLAVHFWQQWEPACPFHKRAPVEVPCFWCCWNTPPTTSPCQHPLFDSPLTGSKYWWMSIDAFFSAWKNSSTHFCFICALPCQMSGGLNHDCQIADVGIFLNPSSPTISNFLSNENAFNFLLTPLQILPPFSLCCKYIAKIQSFSATTVEVAMELVLRNVELFICVLSCVFNCLSLARIPKCFWMTCSAWSYFPIALVTFLSLLLCQLADSVVSFYWLNQLGHRIQKVFLFI